MPKWISQKISGDQQGGCLVSTDLIPCWSVLDFWKINLEKSSSTNYFEIDFYCLCVVVCSLQKSIWKSIWKLIFCRLKIQLVELDFSKFNSEFGSFGLCHSTLHFWPDQPARNKQMKCRSWRYHLYQRSCPMRCWPFQEVGHHFQYRIFRE